MHFNSNIHSVYLGDHVRTHVAKSSFESEIAQAGLLLKREEDLKFALSVSFTFAFSKFACDRVNVSEMANSRTAGFEEDGVTADVADERAMMCECEVGGDELAVGCAFGREQCVLIVPDSGCCAWAESFS